MLKIIPHAGREMGSRRGFGTTVPTRSSSGAGEHNNMPVLISSPWKGGVGGAFKHAGITR